MFQPGQPIALSTSLLLWRMSQRALVEYALHILEQSADCAQRYKPVIKKIRRFLYYACNVAVRARGHQLAGLLADLPSMLATTH